MLTQANSKLADIIAEQEAIFVKRQPKSAALAAGPGTCWPAASPRAGRSPSRSRSGSATAPAARSTTPTATSTWTCTAATAPPWPGTPTRPSSRASATRSARGTHFAQPTENAIVVAGELARRWGLPRWRFANSGTEATMDAVHLMRSYTGRDLIIKVEGGYHGHHDSVQVSVMPDPDEAGPREPPAPGPVLDRHPRPRSPTSPWSPTFNDLDSVAGLLDAPPGPGRRHDRRADHDERRHHPAAARLPGRACATCCTTTARCSPSTRSRPASPSAPAASPRASGVTPDLVCLAKSLGGGVAVAAVGGTRRADGARRQPAATRWSAPSTATRWRWRRPARC